MRIVAILVLTLLFTSCSKDRPQEFSQNQGKNLNSVGDYNGLEFEVITGEALSSSSTTSSSEMNPELNTENPILNNFPLVTYKTKGDSLGIFRDIPFRGKPGVTYKFRYKIHPNMVMVYQISAKEDIPGALFTSAKEIGENLYEIPYAYKPISLVNVAAIKDANGEETSKLNEFGATEVSDATHFKMQNVAPSLYEAQKKVDVLPANLFEGEWFFAVTLTKASVAKSTKIGSQFGQDFNFQPASRVRFEPRRDRIRAVNTNISDKVDTTDDINLASVMDFPVKRLNFRPKAIGAGAGQIEEKLYAGHPQAPNWKKLKYVEVDFTEVKSATTKSEDTALHNFEISKDYFSFDLEFKQENIRLKFAFKRAHKSKQGIGYPKEDRKIYGFFTAQKTFYEDYEFERTEDYEKQIFLSRFYPDNGVITYHISDLTPRAFYPAARRAVKTWDEAFQRAGTGIRVALDETKSVAVGDIRYNIINIVKNLDSDGGGYGPQLADSASGEIISSTANIRTGLFTDDTMETIRNYIRAKMGKFNPAYVGFAPSWGKYSNPNVTNNVVGFSLLDDLITTDEDNESMNVVNPTKLIKSSGLKSLISQFHTNRSIETSSGGKIVLPNKKSTLSFAEQGSLIDTYESARLKGQIPAGATVNFIPNARRFNQRFGHDKMIAQSKRLLRIVKTFCEDDINNYVQDLKSRQVEYDTAKEIAVLESCHDKAINEVIFGVVLHEMGHNFGLRHNFYGATDSANFPEGTDTTKQFGMSSIMDYMGMPKFDKLGNYDVAAIRYAYARKAESKNGIINLKDNVSIVDSAKLEDKTFEKKYKYCTDEDITEYIRGAMGWQEVPAQTDPLCERHQFGTNPEEVVQMAIKDFEAFNAIYGERYDRANGPQPGIAQRLFANTMGTTTLKIYHQWRWHLRQYMLSFDSSSDNEVDRIKKKSSGYLENISAKEFNIIIRSMSEDQGKHGKAFAEYFKAGQMAYSFFRGLLSVPSKFCSVKSDEDQVNFELLSFYTMRQSLFDDNGVAIQSCEDAIAEGFYAERGLTLVGAIGQFSGSVNGNMELGHPDYKRNDILGLEYATGSAMGFLTARIASMRHMMNVGFKPNFLDNPFYREDLQAVLLTRMSQGVHSSDLDVKVTIDAETIVDEDVFAFATTQNQMVGQSFKVGEARLKQAQGAKVTMEKELASINEQIKVLEDAAAVVAAEGETAAEGEVTAEGEADAEVDEGNASSEPSSVTVKVTFDDEGNAIASIIPTEDEVNDTVDAINDAADAVDTIVAPTLDELKATKLTLETSLTQVTAFIEKTIDQLAKGKENVIGQTKAQYIQALENQGEFYPFFAEKQGVLLGQFGQFIKGLQHPEKPELTLDRMQMFTTIKNPQEIRHLRQQNDPRDYAFVSYGQRQYLALRSENRIMYDFIKQAQRLESTRVDAINGVSLDAFKGESLAKLIEIAIPSRAELNVTPIEGLQVLVTQKVRAFQLSLASTELSENGRVDAMNIINGMLQFYGQIIQGIQQGGAQLKAQGIVFVTDMFKVQKMDDELVNSLTSDGAAANVVNMKAAFEERKEEAAHYNKSFKEYEAQRNILSTSILSL